MNRGPFDPPFEALPRSLPIFPLPGVLLLPRGKLPLNIFEPRYLAMTRDALAGDRLIGMIQPIGLTRESEEPVSHTAELYPTGCAGRITAFAETDDGRYLVTLNGLCRFDLVEEIPASGGYRRVASDFGPYRADMEAEAGTVGDRDRLTAALKAFCAARSINIDWEAVDKAGDEQLVTLLAMGCPFTPTEKQALLVAQTLAERAQAITALLELAAHERGGDSPVRH